MEKQTSLIDQLDVKNYVDEMENIEKLPSIFLKNEETLPNHAIMKLEEINEFVGKDGQTAYKCQLIESSETQGSISDGKGGYDKVPIKAGDRVTLWGVKLIDSRFTREKLGHLFLVQFISKEKSEKTGRPWWKVLVVDVTDEPKIKQAYADLPRNQ